MQINRRFPGKQTEFLAQASKERLADLGHIQIDRFDRFVNFFDLFNITGNDVRTVFAKTDAANDDNHRTFFENFRHIRIGRRKNHDFDFAFQILEGLFNISLRNGLATVIISHIAFSISFVVIVVRASLQGFDRRLEEAAQDLGANEWQTFWRVTFPIILPGIIGGALLAFTISLDDFVISFFTTGPGVNLLPIEVYSQVKRSITPKINAISTLMLLVSMTLVLLSQAVQRKR